MPHELRKTRKNRGTRTQGYGRVGQHRKGGSKGRKKAGRHKEGWSYVQRYEPDYFKKKRFKSRVKTETAIINLKNLEEIATQHLVRKQAKKTKVLIDLEKMGYDKLLGTGKISTPVRVKVSSFSETAQIKIKAVGGEILSEHA